MMQYSNTLTTNTDDDISSKIRETRRSIEKSVQTSDYVKPQKQTIQKAVAM